MSQLFGIHLFWLQPQLVDSRRIYQGKFLEASFARMSPLPSSGIFVLLLFLCNFLVRHLSHFEGLRENSSGYEKLILLCLNSDLNRSIQTCQKEISTGGSFEITARLIHQTIIIFSLNEMNHKNLG